LRRIRGVGSHAPATVAIEALAAAGFKVSVITAFSTLNVEEFDWAQAQIGLFSAGASVSAQWAPIAAAAGCVIVDNTSQFRYQEDIPLVVPEVNPEAIALYKNRGIIANPNCSTIQMLVALKPIHDAAGIERINVCTYQAVSGTGKKAIEELASQTANLLNGQPVKTEVYPKQIAFNVLPQIDVFQDNGYTKEEMKMINETQKIFGDKNIMVTATTCRVPVFYCHSECVNVETKKKISAADVRKLLEKAENVKVTDDPKNNLYPMPITAAGKMTPTMRVRRQSRYSRKINPPRKRKMFSITPAIAPEKNQPIP
jgi:aspartate-semialdehyde dehydrogenase